MIGKKVADFTAPATGGEFRLSDHKGEAVVLYFYPKDNTPGCTTEGAQFRDAYPAFRKAGATVVGAASIIDRSGGQQNLDVPFQALATVSLPTYQPESCPLCAAGQAVVKPGSRA